MLCCQSSEYFKHHFLPSLFKNNWYIKVIKHNIIYYMKTKKKAKSFLRL